MRSGGCGGPPPWGGGQNAAAVQHDDGRWEVLQFKTATLIGPGIYELSNLLRGQAGTEAVVNALTPAGAPFVVLDLSLTQLPLTLVDVGLPYTWRYGPAQRDIGDFTYESVTHAFRGTGLRPYAPAHVRGVRDAPGAGDLTISWIRRTRKGGDSWEVAEVPLGEATEAYEIEVLDGATVKRVLSSSVPEGVYPAAAQIADFGGLQQSYAVRVYQLSDVYGRGAGRSANV